AVALERLPPSIEDEGLAQVWASALDLRKHGPIVGLAESGGQDQECGPRLIEGVLELGGAVGRVDVDEDRAHGRGAVLNDDPLVPVRRPDPHPIAFTDSARDQTARDLLALPDELPVRPP